ncbi:MAG: hypothetical protein AB1744_09005, partial [Candidatus Zixiibacteriota bacterium]
NGRDKPRRYATLSRLWQKATVPPRVGWGQAINPKQVWGCHLPAATRISDTPHSKLWGTQREQDLAQHDSTMCKKV